MTLAALKTIEATNYSDVSQTASTQYSYANTHTVTITTQFAFTVLYSYAHPLCMHRHSSFVLI
jgi:hypothetical protein